MVERVKLKRGAHHLDAKQKTFVREYLRNGRSPLNAAIAAGYRGSTKNALNPHSPDEAAILRAFAAITR
jgi:hypothetical protein